MGVTAEAREDAATTALADDRASNVIRQPMTRAARIDSSLLEAQGEPIGSDATGGYMIRRLGASLAHSKGIAPSTRIERSVTLQRALAIVLPAVAVIAGLGGMVFGLAEPPLTGLSLDPSGAYVRSVDPGSAAWAVGMRPGQRVAVQTDASAPAGWMVVTQDNGVEQALNRGAVLATLRLGLIPAGFAAALGLLGVVLATRHRRRAETFGTVGLFCSWIPLATSHNLEVGPLVGSLACAAAGIWLFRWSGAPRIPLVALTGSIVLNLVWFAARAGELEIAAELDNLRFAWTAVLVAAIMAIGLGMTPRVLARRSTALRYVDVAAVTTLLVAVFAAQLAFSPPIWIPIVATLIALAGFRQMRGAVRSWIDRVLFAEERERAGIASAEAERARLSRELHDDPLQALVGVILSLEDQPDSTKERETLRGVAGQLRNIATSLHPPVLDDLGLVPAVQSLFAEQGPVPVDLEIENNAGYGQADRPPFEVELATYRIIQEAATNAIRHSGCQRIVVSGFVRPGALAIDVVDDGRGIRDRELDAALRGGHLGVASMRRRAESIDAQLVHGPGPTTGTKVSLRWTE